MGIKRKHGPINQAMFEMANRELDRLGYDPAQEKIKPMYGITIRKKCFEAVVSHFPNIDPNRIRQQILLAAVKRQTISGVRNG